MPADNMPVLQGGQGKHPGRIYKDKEGNLYFVRAGIGDVYKGFCRHAHRKKGQHHETGIRSLPYRESREQAQKDLDAYAEKRHFTLVEEES